MTSNDKLHMLDTNIFNDFLDGKLELHLLSGINVIATNIQFHELSNCNDENRRKSLIGMFNKINPNLHPSASFMFDIEGAGWDEADWCASPESMDAMLERLKELDKKSGRKKNINNQLRDIAIGYTSISIGAILVTRDKNLNQVVMEFGGETADFT